jgi:hypothetical protein
MKHASSAHFFARESTPGNVRAARSEDRGSVLVVALLVAALIALALGSYLNLNLTSARLAQRSFQQHAAFNLAEAGAEEALWSFNQAAINSKGAWDDWTRDGNSAWRKINGFDFGANARGSVKVYVDNATPPPGTRPKIVSLSSVESPGQSPVTKMIEITLARRSPFANGLMAKDSITFAGQRASFDSWDSDPDQDPTTAAIPYSLPVRNDRGTVASASVLNTAVLINQATVWGYVATGGEMPEVGSQGSIGAFGTPAGSIDPTRVSTDFTLNLPPVEAPEGGTVLASLGATLGTPGEATIWRCAGLTLRGEETLTILGDVTLILTVDSGMSAIQVTGLASIIIPDGSSLKIYTEGDVQIAGNGVASESPSPASFQLWGTHEGEPLQSIDIAGNGELKAVVNAPFARVRIVGNGDVMGSIVAHTIVFTGNADFHYDEALSRIGDGQPYGATRWQSLSSEADRGRYEEAMSRF